MLGNETEITTETAETFDFENKTELWNDRVSMNIFTPTLPPSHHGLTTSVMSWGETTYI